MRRASVSEEQRAWGKSGGAHSLSACSRSCLATLLSSSVRFRHSTSALTCTWQTAAEAAVVAAMAVAMAAAMVAAMFAVSNGTRLARRGAGTHPLVRQPRVLRCEGRLAHQLVASLQQLNVFLHRPLQLLARRIVRLRSGGDQCRAARCGRHAVAR